VLRSELEASYRDTGFLNSPFPLILPSGEQTTSIERDDEDRVQQQLELEARVIFGPLRGFEFSVGYWFLNWTDVLQVDRFTDDVQGGPSFEQEGAAFNGFVFGVSYHFD
jgi:hypothetical protein